MRFNVATCDDSGLLVRFVVLTFCDAAEGLVAALDWVREGECTAPSGAGLFSRFWRTWWSCGLVEESGVGSWC